MKLLWEYPLPTSAEPRDYEYEGPILASKGTVYHAGKADLEAHNRHGTQCLVRLHRIDRESGAGKWTDFEVKRASIPGTWCFTVAGERIRLHCRAIIDAMEEPRRLANFPEGLFLAEKSRPTPLVLGSRLLFANDPKKLLYCFDLTEEQLAWSLPLKSDTDYKVGNPERFGDQIACYGRNALLFLDPGSGAVVDEIRIPRVDKLYSPLADGDDLLLGYTNWSTAGVLRYHRPTRKVVWQYRRKFEGPNSYCRIWHVGDVVVWVKGETELIGLDAASGGERWRTWASPYLYTPLTVLGTDLLFGTAGRGGAIQVVDGLTGEMRWSRSLNNGCAYYARDETSVFVGDFDGYVRRLDLKTGTELNQLNLGTPIVGDIALDGDRLYTVVGPDDERPARLVCIRLHRPRPLDDLMLG